MIFWIIVASIVLVTAFAVAVTAEAYGGQHPLWICVWVILMTLITKNLIMCFLKR